MIVSGSQTIDRQVRRQQADSVLYKDKEVKTRIAVTILNRMLDLGRPDSVRAA
jgi:hypothetical protein